LKPNNSKSYSVVLLFRAFASAGSQLWYGSLQTWCLHSGPGSGEWGIMDNLTGYIILSFLNDGCLLWEAQVKNLIISFLSW